MRILVIGDVIGSPGRMIVNKVLPCLRDQEKIDFIIANGENLAGGKGLTQDVAEEMFRYGVNVLTGGNHTWANKSVFDFIEEETRIVRPANYPDDQNIPGRGSYVYKLPSEYKIGVVNLLGRIYLGTYDCPFRAADRELEKIKKETNLIIVDFHAEATSEKVALGWHLAGRVSAVLGTHTHIPTADETILHNHTAYITDLGMTGPYNSVIGVEKDIILTNFIKQMPVRHKIATRGLKFCGVIIDVEPTSGRASKIERISIDVEIS